MIKISIEINCKKCGHKYEFEIFNEAICPKCGEEHKAEKKKKNKNKKASQ